jgi:hypothetical protein
MKKKKAKQIVIPEEAYKRARQGASVYQISNAYKLPMDVAQSVIRDAASHTEFESHKVNLQNMLREQIPSAISVVGQIMANKDRVIELDPQVAMVRLKAADLILKTAAKFVELKVEQEITDELQPTLFDSVADETGAIELRVVPLLRAVE